MITMTFTTDRRETFGGWTRNVKIDGQEYALSVKRGKAVRIAYKPRGQNRGFQWQGSVYRMGAESRCIWAGRVIGSIGCRGLLIEAGILQGDSK